MKKISINETTIVVLNNNMLPLDSRIILKDIFLERLFWKFNESEKYEELEPFVNEPRRFRII